MGAGSLRAVNVGSGCTTEISAVVGDGILCSIYSLQLSSNSSPCSQNGNSKVCVGGLICVLIALQRGVKIENKHLTMGDGSSA